MPRPNPRHPRFPIPGGPKLRAKGWRQESLLRLLENVLAVGEDPDNLVIYAALGKAARNWPSHRAIVETLLSMDEGETLLIQSGKPVGLMKTHAQAPLVIMANCNIVGQWAKAEVFYELQRKGLIVWGGLTAGAWQYIGSQGVIQGTYEIFMRIAEKRFGGSLAGRFILTAGLGGMGGSQPLAGRMAGAAILCVEVDPDRAEKRKEIGYLDEIAPDLDGALARIGQAVSEKRAISVGLVGNAADVYPEIARRGITPDIVTDQTSAHDLVYGYVPKGMSLQETRRLREEGQGQLMAASRASIADEVRAMLRFRREGARGLRQWQSHSHAGEGGWRCRRIRDSDLHRGLSATFVRSRHRAVSLDGGVGRARRYCAHRRARARDVSGQRDRCELDPAGARQHSLRGPAGSDRLARSWRTHRSCGSSERPRCEG
jgi:urocanate hydratase